MKKITVFLMALFLIFSMTITVSAESMVQKNDSLNLRSDEIDRLNVQGLDVQVVKKYRTAFCFLFPGTATVEELLQSDEITGEWYIILENNNIVSCQALQDGKVKEIDTYVWERTRASEEDFISKTIAVRIRIATNMLNKLEEEGVLSKEICTKYHERFTSNVRQILEDIYTEDLPF